MICQCGNNEFKGHQLVRMDVIVDGSRNWLRNAGKDTDSSIYDSERPYGPFYCTKCNKEYIYDLPGEPLD